MAREGLAIKVHLIVLDPASWSGAEISATGEAYSTKVVVHARDRA